MTENPTALAILPRGSKVSFLVVHLTELLEGLINVVVGAMTPPTHHDSPSLSPTLFLVIQYMLKHFYTIMGFLLPKLLLTFSVMHWIFACFPTLVLKS